MMCYPVQTCGEGYYESEPPTVSSDRVCLEIDPCDGVVCTSDDCHEDGVCVEGTCITGAPRGDGFVCREDIPCFAASTCQQGVCAPIPPLSSGSLCVNPYDVNQNGICNDGGVCGQAIFANNSLAFHPFTTAPPPTTTTTFIPTTLENGVCLIGQFAAKECGWFNQDAIACGEQGHCEYNTTAGVCMRLNTMRRYARVRQRREEECSLFGDEISCPTADCTWVGSTCYQFTGGVGNNLCQISCADLTNSIDVVFLCGESTHCEYDNIRGSCDPNGNDQICETATTGAVPEDTTSTTPESGTNAPSPPPLEGVCGEIEEPVTRDNVETTPNAETIPPRRARERRQVR